MLHPAVPGLGDAATAFVVSRERRWPILCTHGATHGEHYLSVTWIRGMDDATDQPWYKHGGDFRLGSRNLRGAKDLMRDTVSYGSRTLQEVCDKAGIDRSRITLLASVQPRAWIPGAIAQHLGLSPSVAVTTFDDYAHIGGCGPIANWQRAVRQGVAPGVVALYAQGAGFTRAAALVSMQ
jgi:3-oxoacyl-[acyl-carrier-protein] synthase III